MILILAAVAIVVGGWLLWFPIADLEAKTLNRILVGALAAALLMWGTGAALTWASPCPSHHDHAQLYRVLFMMEVK